MENQYDVIIVGSGPAGNSAAIYAARAKLKVVMLDRAKFGGALASTERIANYPGFSETVRGVVILESMRQQALQFGAEFLQTEVYGLELSGDVKKVFTAQGEYTTRSIIVATGAGQRGKRVAGEEEFVGRGVSYCATCDAAFFKDMTVAVVGDGEEACEEALFLAKFAQTVHLVAPRDQLRVAEDLAARIAAESKVTLHAGHLVKEVVGTTNVEGIIAETRGGQPVTIPASGVFFYLLGNKPATDFLYGSLAQDEQGYIIVDDHMATSVAGVFAVGDVRRGVLKQVVTSVADGAIAAMAADKFINNRSQLVRQH